MCCWMLAGSNDSLVVPTALLEEAVLIGKLCLIKCGLNGLASLSLVASVRPWLVSKFRTCCSVMLGGPSLLSSGCCSGRPAYVIGCWGIGVA